MASGNQALMENESVIREQMQTLGEIWRLLRPVWRMLAVLAVVQIAGAFVGLIQKPVGYAPIDLWYGGAYATPLGFIAGAVWQSFSRPGSLAENKIVVGFIAAMSVALPVFGYLTMDTWQNEFPH
jgi:hypothetical protein